MRRFRKFYVMLITALIAVLGSCSSDDNDSGTATNPNTGSGNYTDVAVTGGVQELGITYADVLGYVNYPNGEEYDLPVGVLYGEKEDELTERAYGENIGRKISVTIRGLKPNTKYYYKTFVGVSEYRFVGKQIASFTTKKAEFHGGMEASISDVTFKSVEIKYNIDVSSLNDKEIYETALICSTTPFSFTPQEMLQKFMNKDEDGYNENLLFAKADHQVAHLNGPAGSSIYYCLFLTIGGEAFLSKVQQGAMRTLPTESDFVDLGLSCDWATANLGSDSPFELGNVIKLDKVEERIEQRYGKGCNMPTKEQVEELNQCKTEVIDNGVLLTGLNGNQLFIPIPSIYSSSKDYGTSSIISYEGGTGAYRYWNAYNILFSISNDGVFNTFQASLAYYDSLLPNHYSYPSCHIRAVRNK